MARRTLADLALVLHAAPEKPGFNRLGDADLAAIRSIVAPALQLRASADTEQRLMELREMYESYPLFAVAAAVAAPSAVGARFKRAR